MGVRPLNRPWCARLHNTYSTLTVPTTRRSSHLDDVIGMIRTLGDRYTLDAEIGAGGMATVHRARDLCHGRQVAIKMLRPDVAQPIVAERFLREIQLAARLSHPHILPLFDSGAMSVHTLGSNPRA